MCTNASCAMPAPGQFIQLGQGSRCPTQGLAAAKTIARRPVRQFPPGENSNSFVLRLFIR